MLTAMTEEDWTIVLQVFDASRSRRGDKGVSRPCIISWFTTSRGGLFRRNSDTGTASGNGSGD